VSTDHEVNIASGQAVCRGIHHTATASAMTESPTKMPDSMSWKGENRLIGW